MKAISETITHLTHSLHSLTHRLTDRGRSMKITFLTLVAHRKVSRSVSIPPILEGDTDIGEVEDEDEGGGGAERRKR